MTPIKNTNINPPGRTLIYKDNLPALLLTVTDSVLNSIL